MTHARPGTRFDWLSLWILFSAWTSLSGWILSALGYLTEAGILVSYALFLAGLIFYRAHLRAPGRPNAWRIVRSRFWIPKIWLALAGLSFLGGLAYAPNNYDYLTYRFPRVLYWASDHRWSWIPTINDRMNFSGTAFEWLMAPLLILFKTDRLFFLINFLSYLLLPGLVFSVFNHLGISRRISWWWMWVLPAGYCYILQAASAGNDSFAAVYFLASLVYLFQAKNAPVKSLVLSCLAIALTTGAKASNLPLALPWAVLLFFQGGICFQKIRPVILAIALIVSAAVSFLPTAVLNIHFTGDYAGDPTNAKQMKLRNPVIAVLGNSLQLAKDNLTPPVMPRTIDWKFLLPASLRADLTRDYPRFDMHTGELAIEEAAGVGLGIVLFTALFAVAAVGARVANPGLIVTRSRRAGWILAGGLVAWLVYLAKMGSEAPSRLIVAYYPLLIAGVLVAAALDGRIMRRRVFPWVGLIAILSAFPLVILSPARPLFPPQFVAAMMIKSGRSAPAVERFEQVYRVYSERADAFRNLIASVPPGEHVIGFLQRGDDPEASLWRPFGTRKVIEITPADSLDSLKARGIHYAVINQDALNDRYHTTLATLLVKWSASLAARDNITLKIKGGSNTWYLLKL